MTPFKRGQIQPAPIEEKRCREPSRVGTITGPAGCLSNGAPQANGDNEKVADSKGLSQYPKKRQRKKRGGFVDPAAWVSIQRSLLQQGQLSSSVSRDQAVDEAPLPSYVPSRSSSQRKTLNHFIRELNKYATVAGATRKLPVITPTESTSLVSLHTVWPLLPYLNEFESAGLAVTSEQQKPKHLAASNTRQSSRKPQPPGFIGDGHGRSLKAKPSTCETSYARSTPQDETPTAVLESSFPPKHKREALRRKLPWLKPSTAKPEFTQSDTVAKPAMQLIKDGKIQSRWKDFPGFPATQDADSRPRSPVSQEHGSRVRETAHRDATPDVLAVSLEAHQPSTPMQRGVAIPQLPHYEPTSDTNAYLQRNDMVCTPNKSPNKTDPGSWLPRLPSRRLPGELRGADCSSAPNIPVTWSRALGSGSSLERALSAAIQDVGMKEADTDQRQESIGQAKLTPETIHQKPRLENARLPGAYTYDAQDHPAMPREPLSRAKRRAKSAKKEVNLSTTVRKWEEPALQTPARILPASLHAEPAIRLLRGSEKDDQLDKKAENGTSGLGVTGNDHDDGNIDDRDVLKGLQVAVQAAADEAFDTLIQDKTGLCIRRFLADLKLVGALDVATGEQRAKPRRSMRSRLARERERKTRAG